MRWTLAQWGVAVIALFHVIEAITMLLSGRLSFAIGPSMQVLGMDMNGWHAVAGLLLFVPGLVCATRRSWAVAYLLVASLGGIVPGIWCFFSTRVMWLLVMPHQVSSGVIHLVIAAIMIVIALIQVRIDGGLARSLDGIPAVSRRLERTA